MQLTDTPETDALMVNRPARHTDQIERMAIKCIELERTRNRYKAALEYIAHAGISGRHMEDEARKALSPENV